MIIKIIVVVFECPLFILLSHNFYASMAYAFVRVPFCVYTIKATTSVMFDALFAPLAMCSAAACSSALIASRITVAMH